MKTGMVHLYIGDGKGKTTSALGLLIRAYGAGLSCLFVQFLKGAPSAELETLQKLQIPYLRTNDVKKFAVFMDADELEACRKSQNLCFEKLAEFARRSSFYCIVLYEVLDAVSLGMLPEEKLTAFLAGMKGKTEVILTGRNPSENICAFADYITEMKKRRHPYERGVTARKGIEY